MLDAAMWKEKGNDCIKNNQYEEAILHYTSAIQLDPLNPVLYSNRSLAFLKAGQYYYALLDARETIKLKPDWAKGYFRKGEVELNAGHPGEALLSYGLACRLQPNDPSINAAISQATASFEKLKRREQVPWLCAGVGIIIGVAIVMADHLLTTKPSISHPMLMALLTIAIAVIGYSMAWGWKFHLECQTKSLLEPPVDLLPERNGVKGEGGNETNVTPEKIHARLTKAQARTKYRKGKT